MFCNRYSHSVSVAIICCAVIISSNAGNIESDVEHDQAANFKTLPKIITIATHHYSTYYPLAQASRVM